MKKQFLILGDTLAILLVTVIGFATHGEADLSFLPRMAAAFFPLTLAWFLLSPFLGLYQTEIVSDPKQLWRTILAMVFAAPFAAVVRSLMLHNAVLPVFAVVLAATSALGMLVWRGLYWRFNRKS